jgi:protein-L-isoaspartate(D-aspartate) O-methyltransferase
MVGDGSGGWPEQAPFDRIVVTAAAEEVPYSLKRQIRVGGVLVLPVGPADGAQKLLRIERTDSGYAEREIADVRFVPLIPGKAERL